MSFMQRSFFITPWVYKVWKRWGYPFAAMLARERTDIFLLENSSYSRRRARKAPRAKMAAHRRLWKFKKSV